MVRYAQRLYWVDTLLWLFILGLPAVPGILIREFFDSLTNQSRLSESPWLWIGLFLAVGLARVVAIFTGRVTKTQHRFLMSGLVRHNLLYELLKRPGAELATGGANGQNASPGEILSFFRDDAFQIEDTVVGTNEIFAAGVFAVGSVALLLSVNPTMTLLVFLPLCAIAALAHQAEHRLKRYRRASRQATQKVTGLIGEMFTAVQAVKVAGAEVQMLDELRERCDRRRRLMVRDQVFNAILSSGFENIVSIGTGLILLIASQSLGTQDSLTVGDFALFVYYLSFVTNFLAFFGGFLASIKQSEVSFERMAGLIGGLRYKVQGLRSEEGAGFQGQGLRGKGQGSRTPSNPYSEPQTSNPKPQTLNLKPQTPNPPHPLTHPHPLYLKPILSAQPALPSPSSIGQTEPLQELRVEGLGYRYPGNENGITDISFTLRRGSLTVITGQIGAGKTTLLRVLLGLLPKQSGSIFWNGLEIQDPANFLLPPHAAYTPQTPQLFSASLRENLLLGLEGEEISERLQRAIATAIFDQDLAAMPDGLETLIGTQGFRLSGGQKQRAAAARMLLRQPELFVFDDLSSALDVETEQQLWRQLFEGKRVGKLEDATFKGQMPRDKAQLKIQYPTPNTQHPTPTHPSTHPPIYSPTCLIVSHRPSILKLADQVLYIKAGRIEFISSSNRS
jgi:ATP-binding cassette subfamily C protein